jgi:hypothetical protein
MPLNYINITNNIFTASHKIKIKTLAQIKTSQEYQNTRRGKQGCARSSKY